MISIRESTCILLSVLSVRGQADAFFEVCDSVFGRATAGLDVIHAIEDARVDKTDKPYEDIKMVSISID